MEILGDRGKDSMIIMGLPKKETGNIRTWHVRDEAYAGLKEDIENDAGQVIPGKVIVG